MQKTPAYPVTAADNTLRVLLLLRERGELRVTETADFLGTAASTAHRILAMLCYHGFAIQDRRKIYRPGPALGGTTESSVIRPDLLTIAHPHLKRLSRDVDETTHLMQLEGNGARFIDGVEGTQTLRVGMRLGTVLPAHKTAGGKALLAELPRYELDQLYAPGRIAGHPQEEITALRRELAAVRRRGYAVINQEVARGVTAIGTCVYDAANHAVAALTVAAPSIRCPKPQIRMLAVAAMERAAAISEAVRGSPTT